MSISGSEAGKKAQSLFVEDEVPGSKVMTITSIEEGLIESV